LKDSGMAKNILKAIAGSSLILASPVLADYWAGTVSPMQMTYNFIATEGAFQPLAEKLNRERAQENSSQFERDIREYEDEPYAKGKPKQDDDEEEIETVKRSNASPLASKLAYTISPARRSSNLATLKSAYLKNYNSPEAKAMFDQLFSASIYAAVDAHFESAGLSSQNVGDVFAAYILANWQSAHSNSNSENTDDYLPALAAQTQRFFGNNPNIIALSDAQKQLYCEEMIAQILISSSMNERAPTDPQMKQAAQSFGRSALQQIGLDYNKFKITTAGYQSL
jgi:hypothetical protein